VGWFSFDLRRTKPGARQIEELTGKGRGLGRGKQGGNKIVLGTSKSMARDNEQVLFWLPIMHKRQRSEIGLFGEKGNQEIQKSNTDGNGNDGGIDRCDGQGF
jgi:hypothetical protein